jgi:glycosyltransferase involved in cell wall biosynthesis
MDVAGSINPSAIAELTDNHVSEIIGSMWVEGNAEYVYSQPISSLSVPGISEFYGIHLAIWQIRDADLQKLFPLRTPTQRARYLAWCVVHGQHEYSALRELQPFWNQLSQPACVPSTRWSGGISRLLQLIVLGRPDLGIDSCLADPESQEQALSWYFLKGGHLETTQVPARGTWQRAYFLGTSSIAKSNFVELAMRTRDDLRSAFDLQTEEGQRGIEHWLINHGMRETGLGLLVNPHKNAWPDADVVRGTHRFGVNLIGYAYGELGIGEDVRMAARSLLAAGVPFTIVNIEPGKSVRQNERSLEQWVSEVPEYMFNIVCLTALEHLRVYLERGRALFIGRYTIAYWPWELHVWPAKWVHCFSLADEVWASSKHIARAACEANDARVLVMPMAVALNATRFDRLESRKKFSLPQHSTLFVFSFDGNSYTRRKNPAGIVKAFTKAFPTGEEATSLIIKCMRPDNENKEWRQILEVASRDSRLIVIDEMLSKEDVMELYGCCDCFVSLHRAEGFGRGIAEALSLNLDVIATGYGGNVEFCEAVDASLVGYELVRLAPDEYVEAENNYWAEPDLEAAADAMRLVASKRLAASREDDSPDHTTALEALFSPAVIGSRYRSRLETLATTMGSQPSLAYTN